MTSGAGQLPLDDELAVARMMAGLVEQRRLHHDGLAGAGLAGEHVEAGGEWHHRLLDYGQVADGQLAQHRRRHATAPARRRSTVSLSLPPLELGPEDREEVLLRHPEEPRAGGGAPHLDGIVGLEREAHLAVQGEHHVLVGQQGDRDALGRGQHDRAIGEGVRADRGEHDRVHGREHDGPAGREAVGGRAGGRREDKPVRAIAGGEVTVHRHLEPDDAAHRRLGDDHVVERRVLPEPLALAEDAGLQQHAVLDDQLVAQVGLERGEQLLDGEGGEEAEPAQVDAEDRHRQVSHQARHAEERAVAAQHEQQIGLGRQLRPTDHRPGGLRAETRGLLLEDRLDSAGRAPVEQLGHDRARFFPVRLGDDAQPLPAGGASSAVTWAIRASRSVSVRPVLVSRRKNSRLPLGPLRGEAVTPRTCQPCSTAKRATRAMTARWCEPSRTTPPLPTWPLPTSNWGLTSTTASPWEVSTPKTEGSTFSSEMNEMSTVARSGDSGKESTGRFRALVFSITTTRPSARSLASSWPWPTSTA